MTAELLPCPECGGPMAPIESDWASDGKTYRLTPLRCRICQAKAEGYIPVHCACGAVTLSYVNHRWVENNVVHAFDKCENHDA